jgi:hypothetical protein
MHKTMRNIVFSRKSPILAKIWPKSPKILILTLANGGHCFHLGNILAKKWLKYWRLILEI